jgi:hypothetical protein
MKEGREEGIKETSPKTNKIQDYRIAQYISSNLHNNNNNNNNNTAVC